MSDSIVLYNNLVNRESNQRRVWTVDVGKLSDVEAQNYLKEVMRGFNGERIVGRFTELA